MVSFPVEAHRESLRRGEVACVAHRLDSRGVEALAPTSNINLSSKTKTNRIWGSLRSSNHKYDPALCLAESCAGVSQVFLLTYGVAVGTTHVSGATVR